MKWKPADVVALILVIGFFVLRGLGQNGSLDWILWAIMGAYYAVDLTPFLKVGRNQKGSNRRR